MTKRRRAAGRRAAPAKILAEVMRLSMPPYSLSAAEIGEELGLSKRTVQRYRAMGRTQRTQPEPKALEELGPAARYVEPLTRYLERRTEALLDAAVDAFVAFYERYSGVYFPRHAREWIRLALAHDRVIINVPPRHAKSEICSIWYPIWRIACDRDIQILIISQTERMAKKFAGKIAWHLEFNPKLVADFGRFKPWDDSAPWRPLSGELMVEGRTRATESGDLTLQIRGKGQQVLGMEADIIIADDIVGREDAWSAAERDKTSEYWHGDVQSRRSPKGQMLVIGQCMHHQDLYAELAAKRYTMGPKAGEPLWARVRYPAVRDWEKGEVLWPEEWPVERLLETYEDLKRKGDAWLWEAMYQQNPLPSSARLVMPEWIQGDATHPGCLDHGRRLGERMPEKPAEPGKPRERWVLTVSVDPSPERMTGIVVADVLTGEFFECGIIDAVRARLDVRGILEHLERIAERYHPQYLIFEHNAFARWFLQDPRFHDWDRRFGVRVIPHTTGRNKSDPDYGVQTLGPLFEFGRIRLPYRDAEAIDAMAPLIEEATNYIPEAPKAATYTDLLMALWFIYYNHQRLLPLDPPGPAQLSAGRGFRVPKRLEAGFAWAR